MPLIVNQKHNFNSFNKEVAENVDLLPHNIVRPFTLDCDSIFKKTSPFHSGKSQTNRGIPIQGNNSDVRQDKTGLTFGTRHEKLAAQVFWYKRRVRPWMDHQFTISFQLQNKPATQHYAPIERIGKFDSCTLFFLYRNYR